METLQERLFSLKEKLLERTGNSSNCENIFEAIKQAENIEQIMNVNGK
ncbi:MAG: hypothetical protein LBP85_09525 [Prevotellaceae bacterium]|jgi:hypothetical protein|nr:hypothetical protein [Prevotellaceae bacterium]